MKTLICLWSLLISMPLAACEGNNQSPPAQGSDMLRLNIRVGNRTFSALLYNNPSSQALAAKMPMTLNMSELNGNEKYFNLPDRLPTNSKRVGSINNGDLMLYGDNCLVLFYKSFSTSYSYTKLGFIEDVSGLADILGRGSVQVTFTIAE